MAKLILNFSEFLCIFLFDPTPPLLGWGYVTSENIF